MYADDVQLYISSTRKSLRNSLCRLNDDLERIRTWATANGLSLNPSKSKCLIISKNPLSSTDDILIKLSDVLLISYQKRRSWV